MQDARSFSTSSIWSRVSLRPIPCLSSRRPPRHVDLTVCSNRRPSSSRTKRTRTSLVLLNLLRRLTRPLAPTRLISTSTRPRTVPIQPLTRATLTSSSTRTRRHLAHPPGRETQIQQIGSTRCTRFARGCPLLLRAYLRSHSNRVRSRPRPLPTRCNQLVAANLLNALRLPTGPLRSARTTRHRTATRSVNHRKGCLVSKLALSPTMRISPLFFSRLVWLPRFPGNSSSTKFPRASMPS